MADQKEPTDEDAASGGGLFEAYRRYPWPMAIAVVNTIWLGAMALGAPVDLGLRMNYGLFLGLLTLFFLTLGLARLGERSPGLKQRLRWVPLVAIPALVFMSLTLMSIEFAASVGLEWWEPGTLQRSLANTMSIHLVAAGAVAAFVLPYATGRISNDLFVYWTMESFMAGLIGLCIAGAGWGAATLIVQFTNAVIAPFETVGIIWFLTAIAFSLVWPWYTLSDLPVTADPEEVPPETGKASRIAARWILLPFWLIGGVLVIISYAMLLNAGVAGTIGQMALSATLAGAFTIICYLVALRHRQESRAMRIWARWIGLLLLPVVAMGLYALTEPPERRQLSYVAAFETVMLLWLALIAVWTLVRRDPRTPLLGFSFIAAMIAGVVAAGPLTALYLDRATDDRSARKQIRHLHISARISEDAYRTGSDVWFIGATTIKAGDALQWPLSGWTASTGAAAELMLSVDSQRLAIGFNGCVIGTYDVQKSAGLGSDNPAPMLFINQPQVSITVLPASAGVERAMTGALSLNWFSAHAVIVDRLPGEAPLDGTCPEVRPVEVQSPEAR